MEFRSVDIEGRGNFQTRIKATRLISAIGLALSHQSEINMSCVPFFIQRPPLDDLASPEKMKTTAFPKTPKQCHPAMWYKPSPFDP
jgi:hypothetical protein